jgi:hypothetical protein
VAERHEETKRSHSGSLSFRNIPTVVAGLLGALALVVYPSGFLVYWIQIWREYTQEATPALYAASLMPAPVVAGGALRVLYTASLASVISLFVSAAWGEGKFWQFVQNHPREEFEELSSISPTMRIVGLVLQIFMGATILLVTGLVDVDSASDIFYYACAVTVGGLLVRDKERRAQRDGLTG